MRYSHFSNAYNSINDFKTASDYLRFLYDGANGFAFKCHIDNSDYSSTFYRVGDSFFEADFSGENIYISQNSFMISKGKKHPKRNSENIKRLNALYVDVDCYKCGMTKSQVIVALKEEYFGRIIPVPTFIIDSGRGLYLIWKIKNEDRNAKKRWEEIERYLVNSLEEFGADKCCTDVSRIFRCPFSVNSKSNTEVSILEFNNMVYTLYEIADEYDIVKKKKVRTDKAKKQKEVTLRQRRCVSLLSDKYGLEKPNMNNFDEVWAWLGKHKHLISEGKKRSKNMDFISDCIIGVSELMKQRKGGDCRRENALFLFRLWHNELTKDDSFSLKVTLELNSKLDCPLSEKEVVIATKSAKTKMEKGATYHFSKKRIIEFLAITEEEMAFFPCLKENKRDRKTENRNYYIKSLNKNGKKTKKENVDERIKKVKELLLQGMDKKDIAKELGVALATIYRDIEAIAKTTANVIKNVKKNVAPQKKAMKGLKKTKKVVSHFLSNAIKKMNGFAVPSRPHIPPTTTSYGGTMVADSS